MFRNRILIIDDFFGREMPSPIHKDRQSLCRRLGVEELSGKRNDPDEVEGVFLRGQTPSLAKVGDWVKNDLETVITRVKEVSPDQESSWDLILLDLCFRTGRVTPASYKDFTGMPEGRPEDDAINTLFGLQILDAMLEQKLSVPVVIFSGMSQGLVQKRIEAYPFVLGFLSRDEQNAKKRLRELLAQASRKLNARKISFKELLLTAEQFAITSDEDISNALQLWRKADALVLKGLLAEALRRAGTVKSEPALQTAIRLLDPTAGVTTAKSADLLKRLIRQSAPFQQVLLDHPLVAQAYQKASRLRQSPQSTT
jgi:hypothetical protein